MHVQWWFIYPDTFVPSRYFWINEFSRLHESPVSLDVEIGSKTFVRTSKISWLSEPRLTNHQCTVTYVQLCFLRCDKQASTPWIDRGLLPAMLYIHDLQPRLKRISLVTTNLCVKFESGNAKTVVCRALTNYLKSAKRMSTVLVGYGYYARTKPYEKNQGVSVKHWLCPGRQQKPKKPFLE